MIKKLSKVIVATILVASSLMAESSDDSKYQFNINSLIGFEGGYSEFDFERMGAAAVTRKRVNMGHGGFKIGAESDDYRLFLSARVYDTSGFDHMRTYGVELQYKLNFSKMANFYFGINGGLVEMKYVDVLNSNLAVKMDDHYLGADAGVNIHLGDSVDFEMGARFMSLDGNEKVNSIEYKLDKIVTGYASIIFKYKMD